VTTKSSSAYPLPLFTCHVYTKVKIKFLATVLVALSFETSCKHIYQTARQHSASQEHHISPISFKHTLAQCSCPIHVTTTCLIFAKEESKLHIHIYIYIYMIKETLKIDTKCMFYINYERVPVQRTSSALIL